MRISVYHFALLPLFVALLTGGTPGIALARAPQERSAQPRTANSDTYRADFDSICQLVRDHFYDSKLGGVDWTRITADYRSRLAGLRSTSEFEALVNRMLGELHASHTGYVTDDDVEYYMLPAVLHQDMSGHRAEHIGVTGSMAGGYFLVSAVMEGGPADKAGIHAGDRLMFVDGLPFRSAGSFRGKEGRPVQLQYQRAGEATARTVAVTPVKQNILRAFLDATEQSARILNVSGKRLGYVHLWTMANEAFRTTLDRLVERKLHGTEGLILDLRDGYGGSPWNYADVFFRPDIAWDQQGRAARPSTRYSAYGKPMVVLINQGTRSAKEFLSYEFKVSHRARLVGTRTAGAFLGAGGFEVGKSGLLEIPVVGLKVDGQLLENNGVTPDVLVAPRFTYTEADTQMLAGQRALLDMVNRRTDSNTAAQRDALHP